MGNEAIIVALVGAIVAAIEIIKFLVTKKFGNGKNHSYTSLCSFSEKEKEMVRSMADIITRYDVNTGAPMVFLPRSVIKNQEKIIELMQESLNLHKNMLSVLEQVIRSVERLEK